MKKHQTKKSAPRPGNLGTSTIEFKPTEPNIKQLAQYVDLSGLVYSQLERPIIMVGMPDPYLNDFLERYGAPDTGHTMVKKKTGNRKYVVVNRVVDVYKLCKALDGRTLVHQKAVKAIIKKLEDKYGKDELESALQAA